jgi:hypothetical protein
MDPGFSQLAILWEREKTQSIAFGSSVVAPKRCTGHHLELLAISPTWIPKCAPSITWPGEKKWQNSSCSTPTHSQGSTTEASKGRGMWFLTLQHYTCASKIYIQTKMDRMIINNTKFHHSERIPFKAVTGEVGGAQSVTWCWIEIPSSTVMDPGFSPYPCIFK